MVCDRDDEGRGIGERSMITYSTPHEAVYVQVIHERFDTEEGYSGYYTNYLVYLFCKTPEGTDVMMNRNLNYGTARDQVESLVEEARKLGMRGR